nr:MAG TPA: hypothetical protein [Caudoviricetes sp.]
MDRVASIITPVSVNRETPQHLISSIIAIICRGMYGLRGWVLRKHAGNA